jgi:glutamate-1-semialdehyde 2,1-aminomutase
LADGLREIMTRLAIPHVVANLGPIVSLFLTKGDVQSLNNYRDVRRHCDFDKYIDFQHQMQRLGVYFHPNQFETMFLSTAHSSQDIATALERFEEGARRLRQ